MHVHVTFLPNTVDAVHRLLFRRRVPPRVHNETVICLRQVQPEPARLERNEEHWRHTVSKIFQNLRAVAGGTVQVQVLYAFSLKPLRDSAQVPRELAEHQHPVPSRQQVGQLPQQVLQFG